VTFCASIMARTNPSLASHVRTLYLTAYNSLFFTLWTYILYTTLSNLQNGKLELFTATEPCARWVQTATLVEIAHAASGTSHSIVVLSTALISRRASQIPSLHYSPASNHPRYPSLDDMVLFPRQHCVLACVYRASACVELRRCDSVCVSCFEHVWTESEVVNLATVRVIPLHPDICGLTYA
jgi:hypothetical protein